MVSIVLQRSSLERLLGKTEGEEFEHLLGRVKCGIEARAGDEVALEVTGDRPDLLSAAGIARAAKGMRGDAAGLPVMKVEDSGTEFLVEESVASVRPVAVAAFVELAKPMDETSLVECMQLQEKLHLSHGRRRRKVAIGVHNAEKLVPPFVYKAVEPESVSFVPLAKTEKMNLRQILEKHEKGIDYAYTLAGAKKYPIILDSKGNVVSFPPIINGALTALAPGVKKLFLDVTGSDFEACNTALNILCQDFSDEGAKIKGVKVRGMNGTVLTPVTEPEHMVISAVEVSKSLGVTLKAHELVQALERCRLGAHAEGDFVRVAIPRYRADFLHPADVIEEAALGIGFDNFESLAPHSFTRGTKSDRTKLVQRVAETLAGLGFLEQSGFLLSSQEKMTRAKETARGLEIKNPVSNEYTLLRPSLLPGLLDVLAKNKHADYPQRLFEVGEVLVRDDSRETKTRAEVHVAVVSAHANASLTEVASSLHELFKAIGGWDKYRLEPSKEELFMPGRRALVKIEGKEAGRAGEVSPQVLEGLGLLMPVAAFEIVLAQE